MKTKVVFVWLVALMLALGGDLAMAREGGGFHGNGGSFHGNQHFGNHHGGFHGRFHDFHGRGVFIVGGPFFWDPFYYNAAIYPGPIYVQPGTDYSYYCRNPVGYYPDIQRCPSGWLQVTPDVAP